ncbi:MAG: NADH-quinone oxidoreductase subunit J [Chloroflexi bacterium]|nr:MAG: NADH-quinone oxidoreductase subunit J [Chloroflexota bacterium]
MTLPLLFFVLIGAISLAAAVGVISSRLPVHSALFLLAHFGTLAVLYVTLEAQFLAAVQVIIYAGGIVILILFVIMLIGSERIETQAEYRNWTPFAGIVLGLVLLVGLAYSLTTGFLGVDPNTSAVQGGSPQAVGYVLFTDYILPFELAGVLLLVALLGALLLARPPKDVA